jgi:hypothetical protein
LITSRISAARIANCTAAAAASLERVGATCRRRGLAAAGAGRSSAAEPGSDLRDQRLRLLRQRHHQLVQRVTGLDQFHGLLLVLIGPARDPLHSISAGIPSICCIFPSASTIAPGEVVVMSRHRICDDVSDARPRVAVDQRRGAQHLLPRLTERRLDLRALAVLPASFDATASGDTFRIAVDELPSADAGTCAIAAMSDSAESFD